MEMWIFFTIFGSIIFVPSLILWLVISRYKNRINVLIKKNGGLQKIVITDKILKTGKITEYNGKKIKPISINKNEIYNSSWRRWIIKGELESTDKTTLTDKEIEGYLNNEDLLKLYLAGKFKDTLIMFLVIIIIIAVAGFIINGYMISSHQCIITPDNATTDYLTSIVRHAFLSNVTSIPIVR